MRVLAGGDQGVKKGERRGALAREISERVRDSQTLHLLFYPHKQRQPLSLSLSRSLALSLQSLLRAPALSPAFSPQDPSLALSPSTSLSSTCFFSKKTPFLPDFQGDPVMQEQPED